MTERLVLIRHCHSAVDPASPPETWGLTPRGREQAGRLALALDRPAAVAAGGEPKMVETVGPLASAASLRTIVEPDLGESHAAGWIDDPDEFAATVRAFLEDPTTAPAPGWEPAASAAARFAEVVGELVTRPGAAGPVAVCSGGRTLTAFLGSVGVIAHDRLFDTWRSIRMPDVAVLEGGPGAWTLTRPFGDATEVV